MSLKEQTYSGIDELSRAWAEYDEFLNDHYPHYPCAVCYDQNTGASLSFDKFNGIWTVCYGYKDCESRPILSCTMQERIDAVRGIEALANKLEAISREGIPKIASATEQLREFLSKEVSA